MTKDHKNLIHEGDWDHLIILDACRYDYFKQYADKFPNIQGNLHKAKNQGSNSVEIADRTFSGQYDWTLYSGNILTLVDNERFKQLSGKDVVQPDVNYKADNHFDEVVPIWDFEENEKVRKILGHDLSPRNVFWLMQPHVPWIGEFSSPNGNNFDVARECGCSHRRKALAEALRQFHIYNLRDVLLKVSRLIHHLDGKIVITSDHGEAFGEEGEFGHPHGSSNPVLRTVPWMEIETDVKTVDYRKLSDQEFVETAYQNILGRTRSDEEDDYVRHLETGKLDRKQVYNRVLDSQENCGGNQSKCSYKELIKVHKDPS